jgi:hypothetical protein
MNAKTVVLQLDHRGADSASTAGQGNCSSLGFGKVFSDL